ncbi:MAG: hypothetical protein ACI4VL_06495 [Bacilli bacterium]
MYKKKKNWWSIIFTIGLFIVFGLLFIFIIISKQLEYSKKIELCIETGGMFFTSFALILTYNSLRNEREQKHLVNRPYLLLNDIDFAIEKINEDISQLDFDFSIINRGNGIANRIRIKILKKNNKEVLFNGNYVRLEVADDNIASILANIRDELNNMNRENNYSYSPYFTEMIRDDFYIKNFVDKTEYKNLIVEIVYFDIYGKKYKGTFDVTLDEHFDLKNYKEELREY